jgi:hypothetical protein
MFSELNISKTACHVGNLANKTECHSKIGIVLQFVPTSWKLQASTTALDIPSLLGM